MNDRTCHCYGCGKNHGVDPTDLPCMALQGWYIVSHLAGPEDIKRYGFCSLACLQRWVNEHVETVPQIFLNSFDEY